jgi:predicted nucleic acid-binding protein
MNAIANNTVLSNLAFVDRLDLLEKIFEKVFLTPEVQYEIEKGITEKYFFQERTKQTIKVNNWLLVTDFEQRELIFFNEIKSKVDIGEASCLAIARERGWIFLTDDKEARKIAVQFNIKLSGTVGVLVSAVDNKIISIDEANFLLQAMKDNGYYSPVPKLDGIS